MYRRKGPVEDLRTAVEDDGGYKEMDGDKEEGMGKKIIKYVGFQEERGHIKEEGMGRMIIKYVGFQKERDRIVLRHGVSYACFGNPSVGCLKRVGVEPCRTCIHRYFYIKKNVY